MARRTNPKRDDRSYVHEGLEIFRRLTETAAAAIFIFRNTKLLYINPMGEKLTGYSQAELLDMNFWDVVHPEFRDLVKERGMSRQRGGTPPHRYEFKILAKDGREHWVDYTAGAIEYKGESAVIGTAVDITDIKDGEKALRQWEHIFQHTMTAMAIGGVDRKIHLCNPAFAAMHGYSVDEIIGMPISDMYAPEDRPKLADIIHICDSKGHHIYESLHVRKDGTVFPVMKDVTTVKDENGNSLYRVVNVLDITERRRTEEALRKSEEQLRHSQRLEAVGRLAGGIAHDFNNFLTAIAGCSDVMLSRVSSGDPLRREIEEIRRMVDRAASLTRQLLTFSRREAGLPKVLDLNALIVNMVKMLKRLIGEDVELVTELGKDIGRVLADPGRLEQVIVNLAVNARDAMPHGGKLTIRTENEDAGGTSPGDGVTEEDQGPYMALSVSDTGTGMEDEVKGHIFEPFFTTKGHANGTGLGLSTVYGIVRQCNGRILLQSELGQGTTFRILFPALPGGITESAAQRMASSEGRGTETILVVEDEITVRTLVRQVLEDRGYTVLDAQDGLEALGAVERHAGPIHLVLSDVVMPRMSGRELAEKLAPVRPETKVLFMSGYTNDAIVLHGILAAGKSYIQKPFSPRELVRKVRMELDGTESD